MPIELQIIRASEFVRMGGQGRFDLAGSRAVLMELAAACRRRGIDRALLDVRGARAELTPAELAAVVHTFRDMGFTERQRLAVLHAGDPHHRARLFAFISNLRGWNVRAFGSFEEAVLWLSESEPSPSGAPTRNSADGAQFPEPVPVVKAPQNRGSGPAQARGSSGGSRPQDANANIQDCFSE